MKAHLVLGLALVAMLAATGCASRAAVAPAAPTRPIILLPTQPAGSAPRAAAAATPAAATSPTRPAIQPTPTPTRVLWAPLPTGIPSALVGRPAGQTPTLTPLAAVPAAPAPILPSLSGKLVLQTSSGGDIVVINADGTGKRRLTAGLDPAWSPDGRQVAFTRWTEPQGVYVINADGSGERLIVEIKGPKSPTWSPDGQRIAFTWLYKQVRREPPRNAPVGFAASVRDYWRISVIDLSSGARNDLPLDGDGHAFAPQWSSDGRFVYKSVRGLGIMAEAGPPSTLLENAQHSSPAWSPDGSKVAFMARQHDHWDIAVVNSNGSGLTYLTSAPFIMFTRPPNNAAPVWSPDGRYIAFLSDRDGDWRIYIMNADGTNQRPFLDIPVVYDYAGERVLSWTK